MAGKLTYSEKLLLHDLAASDQIDFDTVSHRALVGFRMAERIDPGMMSITDSGRRALEQSATSEDK